jgi:hypothetical protein
VITSGPSAIPLASSATINWQTNVAADSRVRYGTSCGTWTTVTHPAQVTAHSVVLTGLAPSTLYCYQVRSDNAGGTTDWTSNSLFTTLASEFRVYLPAVLKDAP